MPVRDTEDLSCTERLEFERLLGNLSARFADLPADRVVDELRAGQIVALPAIPADLPAEAMAAALAEIRR